MEHSTFWQKCVLMSEMKHHWMTNPEQTHGNPQGVSAHLSDLWPRQRREEDHGNLSCTAAWSWLLACRASMKVTRCVFREQSVTAANLTWKTRCWFIFKAQSWISCWRFLKSLTNVSSCEIATFHIFSKFTDKNEKLTCYLLHNLYCKSRETTADH